MSQDSSNLFGDYRLITALGHGGMADVYLAVRTDQIGLGVSKLHVIKRLRGALADDPEFIAMLIDEARLAARLNHPNIVQTNEVGKIDGQYFLTMEYLDGQPLHRLVHRLRTLGKSAKALMFTALIEVLGGLQYAHDLKDFDGSPLRIVHRDITPQNIFVTYDGAIKIVDFGIAKATGRSTETREGIIKGKVSYMSPQQAMGQPDIDGRSDIFSVGVMLHETIVGDRMWKSLGQQSDAAILRELVSGNIPVLKDRVPNVPAELDAICKRALAYRSDDRYAKASDMQADLEAYCQSSGMLLTRREVSGLVTDAFADKRLALRSIIEKTFSPKPESSTGTSGGFRNTGTLATESLPSLSVTDLSVIMSTKVGTLSPSSSRSTSSSRPVTKEPSVQQARWVPVTLVASGLIGAMLLVGLRMHKEGTVGVATGNTAEASAATSPTPLEETVQVIVRATPGYARFQIDDGAPLTNPYVARVPIESTQHTIRATAPGFRPRIQQIQFDRDVTLEFMLERETTGATTAPATPPSANGPLAAPLQPILPMRPPGGTRPATPPAGQSGTPRGTSAPGVRPIDSAHW